MADLVEMTVKLPAELLRKARELDVGIDDTFAHVLQEEIDRRAMELVSDEIHAYRREKRAKRSSQS